MEQQRTVARFAQGSESDPFFDLLPSSNTTHSGMPSDQGPTRNNVDSSLADTEYTGGGPSYDFQSVRGQSTRTAGSNGGGFNSARNDDEHPVRPFIFPSFRLTPQTPG